MRSKHRGDFQRSWRAARRRMRKEFGFKFPKRCRASRRKRRR